MPKNLIFIFATLFLSLSSQAHANSSDAEAAALAWLEAIDSGQYEQAWETSSSLLKKPLSPHMLERTIGAARRDFGAVQSRRQVSVVRETSMPGAPRDDYAVLTFQTSFENRPQITETITPHLEEGTWKVSGYYLN
ncbi:DUF4019 domain-containing protein [Halomonas sp. ATBC28]|uniref:DUF4019 domain-containing protein n=1 Tax=Vreelandella titanicae TaxID=664683 RepID=A0A558J4U4_9GAMM|nr:MULTISPECIES: DUF4019 domain-containing protein [Halomonas]MBR9902373.1 DUF4019 domain-containing protein [Gammaproteobacteria bacterium]TMU17959.1 DUF4019 domain-containing protein [Halomonas sp. ATBC28]TVU88668.1 DUF4019 domain-containing protein [Halomonas titanicae]CEP35764.1 Putative uncharacterized protein [Halomonas sp. R57-5]